MAPQVLTGFDHWAEVHQYLADQDKHPKNPGPTAVISRGRLLALHAEAGGLSEVSAQRPRCLLLVPREQVLAPVEGNQLQR